MENLLVINVYIFTFSTMIKGPTTLRPLYTIHLKDLQISLLQI